MKLFKENVKILWFVGGFALGLTMISLGHAAANRPSANNKGTLVSEIRGGKVGTPQFDQDLANLNSLEARYSESNDQQQRIRETTRKVARGGSASRTQK